MGAAGLDVEAVPSGLFRFQGARVELNVVFALGLCLEFPSFSDEIVI